MKDLIPRVLKALLIAWTAVAVCPLQVHYASAGLDGSWIWAMNEAVRQHMVAGRDLMFTYGPLAWTVFPMGDRMIAGAEVQIAVWCLWAGLWAWLGWRSPLLNTAVAALCFYAGASFTGFDLFVATTVLTALACASRESSWRWAFWSLAVALTVFVCFVKFSSAVFAISSLVMWVAAMFAFDRPAAKQAAATGLVGLVGGFAVGFVLLNGTFAGMLDFVRGALEISSGYSIAMSLPGEERDVPDLIRNVIAFLLMVAAMFATRHAPVVLTAAVMLGPLFLTYKHSIVRPAGHIEIVFRTLPTLAALMVLAARFNKREWRVGAAFVLLAGAWLWRDSFVIKAMPANSLGWKQAIDTWHLLPAATLGSRLDGLSKNALAPDVIAGLPVDQPLAVFPYELSYSPANHFQVRISPVPQAYSAYTPYLDEKCARFVADGGSSGQGAPGGILMDWTGIDNRHPLLDVPAWSLEMIRHYDWKAQYGQHALLMRRSAPRFGEMQLQRSERIRLSQFIAIPSSRLPVVAKIHLRWNAMGTAMKFLYKIPELRMSLSGRQRVLASRVVPDVLADGIMANFEPSGFDSLQDLIAESGHVRDPYTQIRFSGEALPYFNDEASVEWFGLPGWQPSMETPEPPRLAMRQAGTTQTAKMEVLGSSGLSEVGSKDLVTPDCPGYLAIHGWAFDAIHNLPAQAVYAQVDDELFTANYGSERLDNVALFKSLELKKTGYTAVIPLARLGTAEHRLRLKVVSSDGQFFSDGEQSVRFRCQAANR